MHGVCAAHSWVAPAFDGGAEILAYHIERSDVASDEWQSCGSVAADARRYAVDMLLPAHTYA